MKEKNHINVPKFGELLTARPNKMSFEEYKEKRRSQNHRLKSRLHGFMVWHSKAFGIVNANGQYVPGGESWGTLVGQVPTVRIK